MVKRLYDVITVRDIEDIIASSKTRSYDPFDICKYIHCNGLFYTTHQSFREITTRDPNIKFGYDKKNNIVSMDILDHKKLSIPMQEAIDNRDRFIIYNHVTKRIGVVKYESRYRNPVDHSIIWDSTVKTDYIDSMGNPTYYKINIKVRTKEEPLNEVKKDSSSLGKPYITGTHSLSGTAADFRKMWEQTAAAFSGGYRRGETAYLIPDYNLESLQYKAFL